MYETTVNYSGNPPKKRRSIPKEGYRRLHHEIFDTIEGQLDTRFQSLHRLQFLECVDSKKFEEYVRNFPTAAFQSLTENYGNFFDKHLLQSELMMIYSSEEFREKSVVEMFKYFHANDLNDAMNKTYKILSLICTIPSTTSSVERSLSSLKRIKTYLRNSTSQWRLSALSILSIEKALLQTPQKCDNFYDNVIEEFVRDKERRQEYIYK